MADQLKNFAITTVATPPSPALSGTSIIVAPGTGAIFPAPPFNVVVWPGSAQAINANAEILRVTAVTTDTFTVTRTQENSSARAIIAGDQIMQGETARMITDRLEVFNVKNYGAVGDGVTDDTVAINAAITACNTAGGGITYVPPATYAINPVNGGILVLSNVKFYGAGAGTIFKVPNSSVTTDNIVKIVSKTNTEAAYFVIDGNRVNQAGSSSKTSSAVNTGTNTITSTAHGFNTNDTIVYVAGTTPIGGLTDRTVYYVIKIDANNFKLATTSWNAVVTVTPITLTSTGTGTQTFNGAYANTQYGLYTSTSSYVWIHHVITKNMTGVGNHEYNNTDITIDHCVSLGNFYHGFECEQGAGHVFFGNTGGSNTTHGILVSPGEVAGTGSKGNIIEGNVFENNGGYGVAFNAANGDVSAWLNEGNIIKGNKITGNTYYGVQPYKQDKNIITGNYIANNGAFGIYLFSSSYNTITGNLLHNNSQISNGAYDEIMVEGNGSGHASAYNTIANNVILIDGGIKARYAINEGTSGDGPNTITNNTIPNAGSSGTINSLVLNDVLSSPGGVVQIGDNGQAIQGANAGFDSAFNHILRLFNNFTSGSTQIVTPNGNVQFYAGGNNTLNVNSGGAAFQPGTGVAAGGSTMYTLGSTGILVSVGSGVPTQSAPQGSLYLRNDGSSSSTRAYINTNGSTTWTAITTAG